MSEPYAIRAFASPEDYRACVELQEATWGEGFSERVSPAILQVGQILGGVSAGAFDEDDRLVGFVFGLTGVRDGRAVHWSDMLAVRPEIRDAGLGRRLKEYQRGELLARGIDTMYWTFDPLQSRNAHLNITRLGAVVGEYRVNMYGESDSPLHQGIGTDRFVALWLMDSERVRSRLGEEVGSGSRRASSGEAPAPPDEGSVPQTAGTSTPAAREAPFALAAEDGSAGHPRPGSPELSLGNDAVRVAIPSDVGSLMTDDMALAVRWREATRAVFERYLSDGYEVVEFERGRSTSDYLLARRAERNR